MSTFIKVCTKWLMHAVILYGRYELQRGTSVSSSIPDDSEPPGDLDAAKV